MKISLIFRVIIDFVVSFVREIIMGSVAVSVFIFHSDKRVNIENILKHFFQSIMVR